MKQKEEEKPPTELRELPKEEKVSSNWDLLLLAAWPICLGLFLAYPYCR